MMKAGSILKLLMLMLAGVLALNGTSTASTVKIIYSFCEGGQCQGGYYPYGDMVADNSGNLFGTVEFLGQHQGGAIFELSPNQNRDQWTYKTVYNFCSQPDCADGDEPYGKLVIDKAGNLYGGTTFGGTGSGVIFELSPNGTYTILYTLCPGGGYCSDGLQPINLTYVGASTGAAYDGTSPLFGTTSGGANNYGNVFSLSNNGNNTWSYSVIHAFCSLDKCADGKRPFGLASNTDGTLFGIAVRGGEHKHGLVFKLSEGDNDQWNETLLHDFCQTGRCTDGAEPFSLSIGSDGALYGTTLAYGPNCSVQHIKHQCGSIFRINMDGTDYSLLYGFCAQTKQQKCVDGRTPMEMTEIEPNDFVGTTYYGGAKDFGTIFEFHNGSFQSLHQFCGCKRDGKWPTTGLTADGTGTLFGATLEGGAYGYGAVYEISP